MISEVLNFQQPILQFYYLLDKLFFNTYFKHYLNGNVYKFVFRAVKQLIASKIKVCLDNICGCTVYNYFM